MSLDVKLRLSNPGTGGEPWSSGDEICAKLMIETPKTLDVSIEAEICCIGRTAVMGETKLITLYHHKTLVARSTRVREGITNEVFMEIDTPAHEQHAPGTLKFGEHGINWFLRAQVKPISEPDIEPESAEFNFEFYPQEVIRGDVNALQRVTRNIHTDNGEVKAQIAVPIMGIAQGATPAKIHLSLDSPPSLILHGLRLVLTSTTVDRQCVPQRSASREFVLSDGLPNLKLKHGHNDLTQLVGEAAIRHRLPESMHSELFSQYYILRAEMILRPESPNWFFDRRKYNICTESPVHVRSCFSYLDEDSDIHSDASGVFPLDTSAPTAVPAAASVSGLA